MKIRQAMKIAQSPFPMRYPDGRSAGRLTVTPTDWLTLATWLLAIAILYWGEPSPPKRFGNVPPWKPRPSGIPAPRAGVMYF